MRAAYPELKKVQGSIVNFASGAALRGQENQVTYAAAKEAIRGISAWSKELLDQYQQVLKGIPLKRLGDPEHDIAPVVAFLASDEDRDITGQTLMSDDGSIMLH